VLDFTGVRVARAAVCAGHCAPFDAFAQSWLDPKPVRLTIGPRGGGKSFLSAIDTHLRSRFMAGYGTRILGGSKAQSEQVYRALREVVNGPGGCLGSDADSVAELLRESARYRNGSEVAILAAGPKSVRGPHVESLKLDEVDEIDPELREAAIGMAMGRRGRPAQVHMTSTWHRLNGPMSGLIAQAEAGAFPLHRYCLFEVLERCPESRSGRDLEKCPACPLVKWCHDGGPVPKAKRSAGHYPIESAVQKVIATSARTFEADMLCLGPKADGVWFPTFSTATHVSPAAEYDPVLPVHLAIDSGVWTGAVWFQVVRRPGGSAGNEEFIHVFADYLSENVSAEANARSVIEVGRTRCNGRRDVVSTDPAGGSRNPVGPTVTAEYERAGLKPLGRWPSGPVADGLALVDSFLNPADGVPRLLLHPRCNKLADALTHYRRAKRAGQWQDHPEDPQHPAEDLVDALRGGLRNAFPDGRRPVTKVRTFSAARAMY
jgi:hypothetical protein